MEEKEKEKSETEEEEELLEVDEKGNPIEKKEKKNNNSTEDYTNVLYIFLFFVFLGLFLKIFIFNKNIDKNKIFLKFKTPDDMYRNVGEYLIRFVKQNPYAKIGLFNSTTTEGLYNYLIDRYQKNEVSFKNIKFYSFDGYCRAKKDENNSYYYALNNSFLFKTDAQKENYHLIREEGYSTIEYRENCKNYNRLLRKDPIDLQILSFGENGTIGFIDQNTDYNSFAHIVKLSIQKRKEIYQNFISLERTPLYAITQGIQNIMKAKEVIVIAKGKNKAKALNDLVNGVFTKKSPITSLNKHPGKVIVFTDEEAGSLIKENNKKF
jgi:glucosamine-6-phosphate deaminase